jgi:hypothetical protein
MMGDVNCACNIGRTAALASAHGHDILMLTSTNGSPNNVVAFKLDTSVPASLSLVTMVPTSGIGGSSGPAAGAQQFAGDYGAVANYGSNTTVSADGQSLAVIYSPSVGAHVAVFSIDSRRHHAVRNFTGHWRDGFRWRCLQPIARHRLTIGPWTQENVDAIPGGNARGKRLAGSAI